MADHEGPTLPRRGMLLGAGATMAGLGLLAAAPTADAAPSGPVRGPARAVSPDATPESTPIGSAPLSGYTYRYASLFDFTPESPTDTRRWGGYGTYTTQGGAMWASLDVPAGARIRDVEWYVLNTSATAVTGLGRIWSAGTGTLYTPTVDVTVGPNSAVTAVRGVVPPANYGPFKLGTRLYLGIYTTDTTGKVQVNGVRVGFDGGEGRIGVLPRAVRAYDTRSLHDPFGANATRTITLPASVVPPGTTAVLVSITAINPSATGRLVADVANGTLPAMPALSYTAHQTIGNTVLLGVTSARQIKIMSTAVTDVVVDIMGTVS